MPTSPTATAPGESFSTAEAYGEHITGKPKPPTTSVVETVVKDEDTPTSDTTDNNDNNDNNNDNDEERLPLWVVLTDENDQPTNDKDGIPRQTRPL